MARQMNNKCVSSSIIEQIISITMNIPLMKLVQIVEYAEEMRFIFSSAHKFT